MNAPESARAAFAAWQAEVAANSLEADPHFAGIVARHCPDAREGLHAFAALAAGPLDELAKRTNLAANLPRAERYDAVGNRTESVVFHPEYHAIGRAAYATGLMTRYRERGRELETLGYVYLLGQDGEAGHTCPLACTAGLIKILQAAAGDAPEAAGPGTLSRGQASAWIDWLTNPDYDRHAHGSQFLTEVQGGSDVGSNAVVARLDGESWRIHGEKWFCSVADAQLFLVTARPEGAFAGTGGLAAFVVPRHLPDGAVNAFRIRRLKDKLGTRSMASAEIDFEGAVAWRVGDFRRTVEIVLNTSRLYNAVVACAFLQRAWREARGYARHRTAFGAPIADFPVIRRILANLRAESCAARASTFFLAVAADRLARAGGDRVGVHPDAQAALRMLVNLNKIWTALTCPAGIREAIEVFGGNGAIEEFSVLPRLLRDSIVIEAWEGGHGVLCAQLLRDSQRGRMHEPMFRFLEEALPTGDFAPMRARWEAALARGDVAAWVFRDVVEELRVEVQGAILAAEADPGLRLAGEHLRWVRRRGYDPLADSTLRSRVDSLLD